MRDDIDYATALAVLLLASPRPATRRTLMRPAPPFFYKDRTGRWYEVDAKGTHRRIRDAATIAELDARLEEQAARSLREIQGR